MTTSAETEVTQDRARWSGQPIRIFTLATITVLGGLGCAQSLRLGLMDEGQPGPGLWPFMAAALVVLSGVSLLFRRTVAQAEDISKAGTIDVVLAVTAGVLFVLLFPVIGFPVPAALLMMSWLRLFGETWRSSLITAAVTALLLHWMFVFILGVPLPVGPLSPGR